MRSRSIPRALLIGAGIVAASVLAILIFRQLAGDGPRSAGVGSAVGNEFDPADFVGARPQLDAPYVVTDHEVVAAMLAVADVRPNEHVIDLGSGDGRILIAAARSHGARGLGVDIDPARVREATANARAARVSDRVEFRRQDLFRTPLGEADVLTLYLTQDVNLQLRPRILAEMRPGARVVSHDFNMGAWRPDRRQRIGTANVYLWLVPARVAGRWALTADGRTATLELEQRFQHVDGRVGVGAQTRRVEQGQVYGERIRFIADLGEGRRVFEGRVEGDRIVPRQAGAGWRAVRAQASGQPASG